MNIQSMVESNEKVVEVARRHWIAVFPVMGVTIVCAILSLAAFYWLGRYGDTLTGPNYAISLLAAAAVLILGLALGYAQWRNVTQNVLVITDRGLYQATRQSLLSHSVSHVGLAQVEDVSASQHGLLPNLLGYGDVMAQTEGALETFIFTQTRNPEALARRLQLHCAEHAMPHPTPSSPDQTGSVSPQ